MVGNGNCAVACNLLHVHREPPHHRGAVNVHTRCLRYPETSTSERINRWAHADVLDIFFENTELLTIELCASHTVLQAVRAGQCCPCLLMPHVPIIVVHVKHEAPIHVGVPFVVCDTPSTSVFFILEIGRLFIICRIIASNITETTCLEDRKQRPTLSDSTIPTWTSGSLNR